MKLEQGVYTIIRMFGCVYDLIEKCYLSVELYALSSSLREMRCVTVVSRY